MRKCFAILALLIVSSSLLFAQDIAPNSTNSTPSIIKPSRDFLMLQFNYSNWLSKPDSIRTRGFGYGFNGYVCYDFPIKKTNLSFAAGIGVSVNVIYLDHMRVSFNDTSAISGAAAHFYATDSIGDKRDKFVTTYLQAPFELRYFSNKENRNKGFKAAIGVQVGTLLGADLKAVQTVSGVTVKNKIETKRYLSPWNFAATARVGYGNFSLFGSYNLTTVFKANQGPPATPFSLGFCLTGL